ncbi:hypothetical protein ACFL4Y_03760 [Gemmatimonadota bacterium]
MRLKIRMSGSVIATLFVIASCSSSLGDVWPVYYRPPRRVQVVGPFLHAASGMTFPEEVADFRRDSVHQLDEEFLGIRVTYAHKTESDPVSISVLVHPAIFVHPAFPLTWTSDVPEQEKREILDNLAVSVFRNEWEYLPFIKTTGHPEMIGEAPITISQLDSTYVGRQATFEYEDVSWWGRRRLMQSELFIFPFIRDHWIVKYWTTHLKGADCSAEFERFLGNLEWELMTPNTRVNLTPAISAHPTLFVPTSRCRLRARR